MSFVMNDFLVLLSSLYVKVVCCSEFGCFRVVLVNELFKCWVFWVNFRRVSPVLLLCFWLPFECLLAGFYAEFVRVMVALYFTELLCRVGVESCWVALFLLKSSQFVVGFVALLSCEFLMLYSFSFRWVHTAEFLGFVFCCVREWSLVPLLLEFVLSFTTNHNPGSVGFL